VIVLGIDPGPTHCGVVLYDTDEGRALDSAKDMPIDSVLVVLRNPRGLFRSCVAPIDLVTIERPQFSGQRNASAELLRTAEVVGRLQQRALDSGLTVSLLTRREVCRELHVSGAGKDGQVRTAMIEEHGGSKEVAVGTKKNPGKLYGVTSHAWQALGLAFVAAQLHSRS
jgi:hypothetical protein